MFLAYMSMIYCPIQNLEFTNKKLLKDMDDQAVNIFIKAEFNFILILISL